MSPALDEQPFFFGNGGHALFGVLHRPFDSQPGRDGFVFCHAFAEEKLWTHRAFVTYARRLAAKGHPVLRFDHTGTGDSQGVLADADVDTACTEIRRAVQELRRLAGIQRVSLLGMRLGATFASVAAEQIDDLDRLAMWAPIVDGGRYMQDLLRSNVMTQTATFKEVRQDRTELVAALERGETVNVDGYEIGLALYQSVSAIKLSETAHRFHGSTLIVQVDQQPKPAPDLQQLGASYQNAMVRFAQEEPFWKEIPRFYQEAPNLFAVTDEWLEAGAETSAGSRDTRTT